jgi:hypothetical protein
MKRSGIRALFGLWVGLAATAALAQVDAPLAASGVAPGLAASAVPAAGPAASGRTAAARALPARQQKQSSKAHNYYITAWGVDGMKVRYTASGNLIRFSYRVAEPERAKVLADKRNTPYLIGQRSRAVLQVPVMDKVGILRQAATPVAGQEYWMVFSNKGNLVKPGDRVNVVIGSFHADGLMVE